MYEGEAKCKQGFGGELGIDGIIILKSLFKKWDGRWIDLALLASQEESWSMESVNIPCLLMQLRFQCKL
jgi:hypothetical protein